MRERYWNQGEYAGYPDRPELQLDWFVDHALLERTRRLSKGLGLTELDYGQWIADVEKPAAQYRGRYQLRLTEARSLIGSLYRRPRRPAVGRDPAPPERDRLARPARAGARRVSVKVDCGAEDCSLEGRGS